MKTPDILAFVLAGGQGSRLHPLTASQSKPALQIRDGYRLVDFVLSNLLLSGVRRVYLLAQYKPQSLISHVQTAWTDRFEAAGGFIQIRVPSSALAQDQFQGTADAVYRNRELIDQHQPDLVAVFAADHVYRMDVQQMARWHRKHHAHLSVAAVPVAIDDARSLGVIATEGDGRIVRFEEKPRQPTALPDDPTQAYGSMGNYLFEPHTLIELLEENVRRGGSDFGFHILPNLPFGLRAFAYDFSANRIPGLRPWEVRGYWRDVGTLPALRQATREVSLPRAALELMNPRWPILGVAATVSNGHTLTRRVPARVIAPPGVSAPAGVSSPAAVGATA